MWYGCCLLQHTSLGGWLRECVLHACRLGLCAWHMDLCITQKRVCCMCLYLGVCDYALHESVCLGVLALHVPPMNAHHMDLPVAPGRCMQIHVWTQVKHGCTYTLHRAMCLCVQGDMHRGMCAWGTWSGTACACA